LLAQLLDNSISQRSAAVLVLVADCFSGSSILASMSFSQLHLQSSAPSPAPSFCSPGGARGDIIECLRCFVRHCLSLFRGFSTGVPCQGTRFGIVLLKVLKELPGRAASGLGALPSCDIQIRVVSFRNPHPCRTFTCPGLIKTFIFIFTFCLINSHKNQLN